MSAELRKSVRLDDEGRLELVTHPDPDDPDGDESVTVVRFWLTIPDDLTAEAERLIEEWEAERQYGSDYRSQVEHDYDSTRGGF